MRKTFEGSTAVSTDLEIDPVTARMRSMYGRVSELAPYKLAVGISTGDIKPIGYEETADAFKTRKMVPAHCIYLLAEASVAGIPLRDVEKTFPKVYEIAEREMNRIFREYPQERYGTEVRGFGMPPEPLALSAL